MCNITTGPINGGRSPWIKIDAASSEKMMRQVNQYPSDALSFEYIEKEN